jgi:hypothetical protein
MFNYSRTYFFYPLIHFALLAVALWTLAPRGLPGKAAVASLVLLQCAQGMRHADWYLERDRLSYRQYVSREAFDQAEALMEVDRARVRVACVGFYPSRAHLNGFNTIGGYCPLYPARVKRQMRQVVEAELAKSDEVRRWFETNGHRCYVWSAELGWLHDLQCLFGTPPASIRRLEIDSAALARMGAHFVLSALPIDNAASIDLELVGVTDEQRQADHLRLWVYRTPMVRRAELSTADPGSEGE